MRLSTSGARSFSSVATAWPRTRSRRRSVSFRRSRLPPLASWPVMRKVIVTGGSRGLGLGIVRRLSAEGYCAVVVARTMNDQLASAIDQSRPDSVHFMPFDLGDVQEIPGFVRKLRKHFGPIHG